MRKITEDDMSKYKNKKYTATDGEVFDSYKEYKRYFELSLLEKAGQIRDLKRQVKFVLIPTQREYTTEVYKKGEHKGELKPGRVLEKECAYYADFTYYDGNLYVVEDAKGVRTEVYNIKKKLMLKVHGIRIKEV